MAKKAPKIACPASVGQQRLPKIKCKFFNLFAPRIISEKLFYVCPYEKWILRRSHHLSKHKRRDEVCPNWTGMIVTWQTERKNYFVPLSMWWSSGLSKAINIFLLMPLSAMVCNCQFQHISFRLQTLYCIFGSSITPETKDTWRAWDDSIVQNISWKHKFSLISRSTNFVMIIQLRLQPQPPSLFKSPIESHSIPALLFFNSLSFVSHVQHSLYAFVRITHSPTLMTAQFRTINWLNQPT